VYASGYVADFDIAMKAEFVPDNVSQSDLRDEVNRRTAKAGYTTRLGECPYRTKIQNVVGFGQPRLNVWPRDEHGNLIGD
jgi:hypothetical protein